MKKLTALLTLVVSFSANAQTLFYYANDSISAKEFLRAYQKNNTATKDASSISGYLNLYIASRLKIAEAKRLGYDTLPQMVADLDNLRQQILPNYLSDKESLNKLVNEAFARSQKDIRLAHIFISTKSNTADELAAATKKSIDVAAAIKSGENFGALAKKYSDDPAAATNAGNLGWITVFSLPYQLENLAYTTPVGKTSATHRSKAGYHLFKNLGERKAAGRMKAAQILLAFSPGDTEAEKLILKKRADSIYNRILKGDDFGKLATQFSNDVISSAANGLMPEFGVGQYDVIFESKAFALAKNGAVSPPFATEHGYHIVKRLGRTPVIALMKDEQRHELQDRVDQSDRNATIKTALVKTVMQQVQYKKLLTKDAELWDYSDSVLNNRTANNTNSIKPETTLLSLNNKTITSADWIGYAQTFRFKPDGSGIKNYPQLWDEFVEAQAMDYYQHHLEDFNEDFRQQVNEFKEGNLFFEIMQKQIWGPAQTDSAALENYFEKNKANYKWQQSAEAVIFYAADTASARIFLAQLKKKPTAWQTLVSNMGEKISADSGRFEFSQIPGVHKKHPLTTGLTTPQTNKADGTVSMAYIIKIYPQGQQRNFADAKGLVINDYQSQLEKQWIEELKKKYAVRVNERVLRGL